MGLLNGVAEKLRAARVANGALRIDGVKLRVQLGTDGQPNSVTVRSLTIALTTALTSCMPSV